MFISESINIEDLINGCASNDRRSQELLYKQFYNPMMAVCFRYIRNREDALEVLHTGFLKVFQNIKNILEAAGGNMNHLVKLGYFTTDVSRIQDIRTIRDRFINTKNPPASTLVQVNKLFRDDVLIEIEATAIIPK